MKTAIVTGDSSGIGLEIVQTLLSMGYKVYGLSRRIRSSIPADKKMIPLSVDLLDEKALRSTIFDILSSESSLDLLVNNAGVGLFGPHEELEEDRLSEMIRLNLEVPILLCRLTLRALKKSRGKIINISSVTAERPSTHACAYAATKAGLTSFSKSLFEEVRKSGVGITVIQPDLTRTPFYDSLNFSPANEKEAAVLPGQVANAIRFVLTAEDNMVVSELTLRPQINRIVRKSPLPPDGQNL